MESHSESTKRIAKNTLLLYVRTIFTLLVSLYTSRVILQALGVEDYGIYNVVGGLVSMFSVISSSLCGAIGRFITYGLGKGDIKKLRRIFSTSLNIQIVISILVLGLGIVIGAWFLNNKLSIPDERLYAANWVLYCSLFSFVVGLISVPFNSCIISHEHMNVFAYISIFETVLKLIIVYVIYISPFDKLITYTNLFLLSSIITLFLYIIYCRRHFEECKYALVIDKPLVREMGSFAGWSFFGNIAYILNNQGINLLINIFFGVTMNAARGIAGQVQNAILQFVNNFSTAINPQITKSCALGDYDHLYKLICQGAKYSYYLLLIFTVPIFIEADYILKLWLGIVPEYSVIFLRLILITSYVTVIGNTSFTAIMATGVIRNYQIVITLCGCLVFPFTWIFYKLGYSVTLTYYIYIIIYFLLNFIRLYYLKKLIDFPIMWYIKGVIFRIFVMTIPAFFIPLAFTFIYNEVSIFRVIGTAIISFIVNLICIYWLGLDKGERGFIYNKIKQLLSEKCHLKNI